MSLIYGLERVPEKKKKKKERVPELSGNRIQF